MNGGTEMDVREKLVKQAISHFEYGVSHDIFSEPVTTYAKLAIEALEKEKEIGVTVQEWVSVKDRLPEHGDFVVVWHTYMEHPFVCQWDERSDCWIDDKWTFGRNTITHWCYLPQPPKGE